MNQSKANVSVIMAATSSGRMLSPYVIYKSTYLYDLWSEGEPPDTFYNCSKSRWMGIAFWTGSRELLCHNVINLMGGNS